MLNQDALPQILFPVIPSGACFRGTQAEIFNQLITLYLNQAVINIAGLGDVTPAQIAAINAELISLQNQINAITLDVRSGNVPITTGDNNVPIVFSTPMPDADYDIVIEFIDTAGSFTAASPGWAVVGGTKLATGVTIRTYNIPADIPSFDYTVRARTP